MDRWKKRLKEERMNAWVNRKKDGRKEGRMEGRIDRRELGRSSEQKEGREEERSVFLPEICPEQLTLCCSLLIYSRVKPLGLWSYLHQMSFIVLLLGSTEVTPTIEH